MNERKNLINNLNQKDFLCLSTDFNTEPKKLKTNNSDHLFQNKDENVIDNNLKTNI